MNSVLRIALSFFNMVALQRWLNGVGLVMIAAGLALGLVNELLEGIGFVLVIMGLVLIGITPVFAGGVGMRFASTRALLHLRPHGRAKLLLGSTLAITLLAILPILPALLSEWVFHSVRPPARAGSVTLMDVFHVSWTALALMWICIFSLSRSMLAFALMGVIPVAGVHIARHVIPMFPSIAWVFVTGLLAWAAFAAWYLRTPSVERPIMPMAGAASSTGLEGTSLFSRLAEFGATGTTATREHATYQYLFGCATPWFFVLTGLWVGALFLVVAWFSGTARVSLGMQLLTMLPFYAFFNASLGYTTARRARFLWLRTDMDRSALFGFSERWNNRSAMAAWGVTAAIVLVVALLSRPELAAAQVTFVLMQAVMALAMGYLGLATVRDWSLRDIAVAAVVGLIFIAQALVLAPRRDAMPMSVMGMALVAAIALTLLLRAYAAYRWRDLDWRVAKVARFITARS